MTLGKNIRRTMRHITLTAYKHVSQIDNLEDLAESQLTDIRTVCAGFRIADRLPVYKSSLDHVADNLLSRTESIVSSKLVAACAYYLCRELVSAYAGIGHLAPTPIVSLARGCDLATGERDSARFLFLLTSITKKFHQTRPDVTEAIARAIGVCAEGLRTDVSSKVSCEERCRALTGAIYVAYEQNRNDTVRRLAKQLAKDALSDGYGVIADLFDVRAARSGTPVEYLQAVRSSVERASLLDGSDPARELACSLANRALNDLVGGNDGGGSKGDLSFAEGIREMGAGNHGQAVRLLNLAADQFDNPYRKAMAAIFSFCNTFLIFRSSRTYPCGEVEAALHDLTASGFAAARNSWDCSDLLRLVLNYCAARAGDDHAYDWLSARVADLLGEYSAGAAIGSDSAFSRVSDVAARELAINDLLAGSVPLPSVDVLRMVSQSRTVVWVNQLTVDGEPWIVTQSLGPHDNHPQMSAVTIRSSQARELLNDAVSANLDGSQEEAETLRRWIFQRKIDPGYPIIVIADRKIWSLPWAAIVPESVPSFSIMPSAAAVTRLGMQPCDGIPVVAGVFDLQLEGARTELSVLEALHREGKVSLRSAASLAELTQIAANERIDLLTIATHGTSGDSFEYRLMFPDSPASPTGILGMRLPSRVVLGCCWSARLGERADSVATAVACMAAGASSVVGALWDVDDRVAGSILASAYRDFAAGRNLSDAIRSAYLNLPTEDRMSGAALAVLGLL